ncbi:hypothetical protein K1719_019531 [Acacia pycnantha]|nr:hypothetical protein K1719_019531 [Acacia pycnantha]
MNIVVWNSRGATSKGFATVLKDMKFRYKLDVVVILEPRISGSTASRVIKNWGFKHSIRREAEGFSGGIWILWNLDDLIVDVMVMDDQFIHCNMTLNGKKMCLTAIYASPNERKRCRIWDMLRDLSHEVADPWLLAGDFNEIKTPLEQKGGGRANDTRCKNFNDWIQDCNLIDLEAHGPFFTWKGPKWNGLERLYKRLDRCLCNISWQEQFSNAEIRIIPRVCSDHHPVLVSLAPEIRRNKDKPFRYEVVWQMHVDFNEIVKESWKGEEEAHVKLSSLQQSLLNWNKAVFGRIESKKRRILDRLNVLAGKYGRNMDLLKECRWVKSDSELWKNLCRLWPTVLKNVCWDVGNGEKVRFWSDKWLDEGESLAGRWKVLLLLT